MTAAAIETARIRAWQTTRLGRASGPGRGGASPWHALLRPIDACARAARAAERASQALTDALTLGPTTWRSPAALRFSADGLLLAACVALASRGRLRPATSTSPARLLMAVSVVIAMVLDSMYAALSSPLAHALRRAAPAFKAWIDFLFAAGTFLGPGFISVLWADARRGEPLLPRPSRFSAWPSGGSGDQRARLFERRAAHAAGHRPSVTFGCLVLAVLGVRILRRGPITD